MSNKDKEVKVGESDWFVVDATGRRQHDGMITESEADTMLSRLLTESSEPGKSSSGFQKKKYLKG